MSGAPILRAVLSQPSGAIGITLVVGHVMLAGLSPLVLPHDPIAQSADLMLQMPNLSHPFGPDRLGRYILSRVLLGGREAMPVATLATLGATALIPILGCSYGLSVVYIARAAALDFVARDFVLAAQARGEARATILIREILPNVRDTLAVQGAMQWSWLMLGITSLSFLGLGVAPPTPDWGLMIADARGVMPTAPWAVLWPMAMLSTLIVGVNLAADAFAKALGVDRQLRTVAA